MWTLFITLCLSGTCQTVDTGHRVQSLTGCMVALAEFRNTNTVGRNVLSCRKD